MKIKLLAIPLAYIVLSCTTTNDSKTPNTTIDTIALKTTDFSKATQVISADSLFMLESYLEEKIIDTSKYSTIKFDCAILIYPTDEQITAMRNEYGEEDFSAVADDANYYQSNAISILDSMKINAVSAEKSYLKLKGEHKEWTLNIRRKGLPEWNLILFNVKKEPVVMPAIDLTAKKIEEYF